MSLDETLFVGTPTPATPLPLDEILEHYAVLRHSLYIGSASIQILVRKTSVTLLLWNIEN